MLSRICNGGYLPIIEQAVVLRDELDTAFHRVQCRVRIVPITGKSGRTERMTYYQRFTLVLHLSAHTLHQCSRTATTRQRLTGGR